MVALKSWMWTGSFDDVVAEVVGLAVREAALDAAAGHPHAEVPAVMVAAVVAFECALRERCAAELRAEDHERIVEQAALLQVRHETRGRLVDGHAEAGSSARNAEMVVPSELRRPSCTSRRARPAGARAGSCAQTCRACAHPDRTGRARDRAHSRCPRPRAPTSASGTTSRTG